MPERPQDPAPTRDWFVLTEETVGSGDQKRWSLTEIRSFFSHGEALAFADDTARTYQPRHPSSPRNRRVFRVGEDIWITYVEGAMQTFHFRVSVARSADA
ncbi:hypothetical protein EV192_105683 [Actinocrispum wychmicini]|uniref:Uncharacterized protein n=1 Tax=Actinocrispum wychmicini TaxID=1213861 RepID=A0A4R2JJF3_9PSEU|nr:hypothetical protein EV192_105683 [Actinocrispum wychmicini]